MSKKETYYLVQYHLNNSWENEIKNEGVFTEKGFNKWIKEENEMRDEEDKWAETMQECSDKYQFIFTEIKVYK